MPTMTEIIRTTCPRDCYDSCGILVVKRDGLVRQVRGDPDHYMSRGKLCEKCSAGYNREWRDASVRLTRPLRRVGRKGEGRFEPISWDVAFAAIAERFGAIAATSGAHTIINAHYTGTISLLAFLFPPVSSTSRHRSHATRSATWRAKWRAGPVWDEVSARSPYGQARRHSRGGGAPILPPHTARRSTGLPRPRPGVVSTLFVQPRRRGGLHLQPYPGTDAALAYALLHVLRRDGLVDRGFIEAHTVGWEELEPLLDDCTPSWGEATTGVPAPLIEKAATLYGSGPSLLWLGQGLQRQATGGNVVRACAMLPAVTGNVGKPGAGFLYLNQDLNLPGGFSTPT